MSSHPKNTVYVDQDSPAKPPVLHPGDITPAVMREFEDSCIGYFENKEIEADKQVRKILTCLRDSRIKDWISTDRDRLLQLSFSEFMKEFRAAYLDDDWEEGVRRELGNMMQGPQSFWDYAIQVQAKNSLLISTASHLDEDKLRHRIEAGMEESLSRHCVMAKMNQEKSFKKWVIEVKKRDDLMHAERKEFEIITKSTRELSCKANPLGEPSLHANTMPSCGSN
jgi:hypothetical protein